MNRPRAELTSRCRYLALILILVSFLVAACATIRTTNPPRTATEQFLISYAVTGSLVHLDWAPVAGQDVFIDLAQLEAIDRPFIVGEIRARLLLAGARLVNAADQADVVIEPRSAGVGIDRYEFMIGIPGLPIPGTQMLLPGDEGSATTPELPIIRFTRQSGYAAIGVSALEPTSGTLVMSDGPYVGKSRRHDFWFLGLGPVTGGDVPPEATEISEETANDANPDEE